MVIEFVIIIIGLIVKLCKSHTFDIVCQIHFDPFIQVGNKDCLVGLYYWFRHDSRRCPKKLAVARGGAPQGKHKKRSAGI